MEKSLNSIKSSVNSVNIVNSLQSVYSAVRPPSLMVSLIILLNLLIALLIENYSTLHVFEFECVVFHNKATSPLFLDFLLCLRVAFCHSSTSKKSSQIFKILKKKKRSQMSVILNLPQKKEKLENTTKHCSAKIFLQWDIKVIT